MANDSTRVRAGGTNRAPEHRLHLLLGLLVALSAILRTHIAAAFNLFTDEILYAWIWTIPPLSFSPHPPAVPALATAGVALLGRNELGARLSACVLGTLVPPLVSVLGRCVASARAAAWAALASLAIPAYFVFGVVLTPDCPLLVLWLAGLVAAWHALETGRLRWWLATGVAVGAGMLTKYMMVFFPLSLALCMAAVPRWRRHWRTAGPWLALGAAAAIFLPAWALAESRDGWRSLRYHLSSRQTGRQPSLRDLLEYQGVHFIYYSPVLYAGMVAATGWALVRGWKERSRQLVFLGIFAAVILVFFAVVSAVTRRVLSREQWDAPAYATALVAFVLMVRRGIAHGARPRAWRALAVAAPALGALAITGAFVELETSLLSRALGRRPYFQKVVAVRPAVARVDASLAAMRAAGGQPMLLGNSFHAVLAHWFYGGVPARRFTLDHASHHDYGVTYLLERAGVTEGQMTAPPGADAVFFAEPSNEKLGNRGDKLAKLFTSVEDSVTTSTPQSTAHGAPRGRVFICRGYRGRPAPAH